MCDFKILLSCHLEVGCQKTLGDSTSLQGLSGPLGPRTRGQWSRSVLERRLAARAARVRLYADWGDTHKCSVEGEVSEVYRVNSCYPR